MFHICYNEQTIKEILKRQNDLSDSKDPVDNFISSLIAKWYPMFPLMKKENKELKFSCPICHNYLYSYVDWEHNKYCENCGQTIHKMEV